MQIVVFFSSANAVATLVGNRLLTQTVNPHVLGELTLLMNLALWLTLPTASGYAYVVRHWRVAREHRAGWGFTFAIGWGLVIQAGIAAIGVVVYWWLGLGVTFWGSALLLWLICVGQSTNQAFDSVQAAERRRTTAGLLTLMGNPLRMLALALGGLILVPHTGEELLGVQSGYYLLIAVVTTGLVVQLLRREEEPRDHGVVSAQLSVRSFVWYSLPYVFSGIVTQVCASAERWRLSSLDDPSATAYFVQAVGLSSSAVAIPCGVLISYYLPVITHTIAKVPAPMRATARLRRDFLRFTGGSLVAVVFVVIVATDSITPILFGPKYAPVSRLLPWTTAGAALFQIGQVLAIHAYIARDTFSPNAAHVVSQMVYAALLILWPVHADPALTFSKIFLGGRLLYVVFILLTTLWIVARSRRAESLVPLSAESQAKG